MTVEIISRVFIFFFGLGLSPFVSYEFRVVSAQYKNNSDWTLYTPSSGSVQMTDDIPIDNLNMTENLPSILDKFEAVPVTANVINLTWVDPNENIQSYSVCFIEKNKNGGICDETSSINR